MCCDPVVQSEAPFGVSGALHTQHIDLPPAPSAARQARRFVAGEVGEVGERSSAALAVLTSELVTNAVLHARTHLQVGVMISGEDVMVSVGDHAGAVPRARPESEMATRGRGLSLLEGLADRWGATTYSGGKSVWFVLRGVREEAALS